MTTQKKLVFLFIAAPLLLPFFITIAYSSFRFVKLNVKKLDIQNEYSLERIAKETIQVIKAEEDPLLPGISPETWLFQTEPKRDEKIKDKPIIVVASSDPPSSASSLNLPEAPPKIIAKKEEDPFLSGWREKQQSNLTVLNTQKVDTQGYLNYADVQGSLEWPDLDRSQFFAEVSFYDQIGDSGLNDDLSTVLASQELRADSEFLLKLPVETTGYLIAKIYAVTDSQKEKPLYVGAYSQNPLFVPKEGIQRLLISMIPTARYVEQYQTIFFGKVMDEYVGTSSNPAIPGISGVDIWVVETQEHVQSDEKGFFEIKGLSKKATYHLIFEKAGFVTIQIPVQILGNKNRQMFVLSPSTKFTQGYDFLLGERDSSRSILFATVLKGGAPLSRVVIMSADIQKIFYERNLELVSIPDATLFSTTENGKFVLWNASPTKHKLYIYQDGELIGSSTVKLSPGIVHYFTIEL